MKKPRYLSVVYDETTKPLTRYPYDFARYLYDRFNLRRGYALLDTGCGRGEMLNAFGHLGLECSGCDIEVPPAGSTECDVEEVDLARSPFPYRDESFDVVFSKSVLEHIWEPAKYLSEVQRVLRADGILIILTPAWESQIMIFYEDPTHLHPYTATGLEALLQLSGFRDVQVELFSHHQLIWRNGLWRAAARALRMFISTPTARRLTEMTGVKFFRWAVELQVLGVCSK